MQQNSSRDFPHYHTIMKRIKFLRKHAHHCHVINQIKVPATTEIWRHCNLVGKFFYSGVQKQKNENISPNILNMHPHYLKLTLLFDLYNEIVKHFVVMSCTNSLPSFVIPIVRTYSQQLLSHSPKSRVLSCTAQPLPRAASHFSKPSCFYKNPPLQSKCPDGKPCIFRVGVYSL